MTKGRVDVDERTAAVDEAAGNSAYKVMAWLLVVDLAVRAKWPRVASWHGFPIDVLIVLCAGCLTWTWFAWRRQIISRHHLRRLGIAALAGVAVAAGMILLLR